ncbi:hypothetical protein L873DRAFT_1793198 [Choiromyces venosus 120613-1]|uniref:Uncharacterized protein n=1 Tax=Choiromyces venosus 120613-1 TaxID=1336337 RepID=A0A3N4J6X1_9PEZI|nr:hypothetical protein L873DRAFT_1793198 [Choiromyces venosus 120613-1]
MTTTSPVTNDLIDLFTTNFFVRSSPSVPASALTPQLPAHISSRISVLDIDCDYSGPPVSPDLKHTTTTASLNPAPTGDLLLISSDDNTLDSTCGGGSNSFFLCFIESPPSHNRALSGTLTAAIPPHLRDSPECPRFQRKPSAWCTKDNWRKTVKSLHSEKHHGGISSLRQSSRWLVNREGAKRVTVGLNKFGHGGVEHVKNVARGPSRDNGGAVWNGTTGSSQVKLTVGQTHNHPVRAVSHPAVSPILAQRVVALAPPEVAPVTWSGWGLPFEGLTSRRGVDAPVGTTGCHRAGTVSYKRTSPFKCEEIIPEQLRGTRRVAPPLTNISPAVLVEEDSWANQEVNRFFASGPEDSCSLLYSFWVRHMIGLLF